MVLRNSRSIQKHRSQIKVQLSYCEWHVTGRVQWYCGTREVSRSIEVRLKFNYHIANDTWPDAYNGIAELEKYPEASKSDWSSIIILRMTRDRTRTMVLRNSRSIQKHRSQIEVQLSYCEWHVTGRVQWYCGTREVSRSIEVRLKFNYHIANDTWPDAYNGIAELEKYPEASNRMRVLVLRYARGRMRIRVKEPCNEILSFVGHIWRHVV